MSDQASPDDQRFPRRERHTDRNAHIRAEYERRKGERALLQELAKEHGLTPTRINQIVHGRVRK